MPNLGGTGRLAAPVALANTRRASLIKGWRAGPHAIYRSYATKFTSGHKIRLETALLLTHGQAVLVAVSPK